MKKLQVKSQLSKVKSGYTLVEVIVAMAIFTIIMVATANFFGSSVSSYKNAKAVQKDVENAQFAMNLMAKTLRTSSMALCYGATSGWQSDCSLADAPIRRIRIYDYSQGKCIQYRYGGAGYEDKLQVISKDVTDLAVCKTETFSGLSFVDMAANHLNDVRYDVTQSCNGDATCGGVQKVGKVTTSMEICATANCSGSEKDKVRIQSSLSLRDFKESGL